MSELLVHIINPSPETLERQERAFSEHGWLAPLMFAVMTALVVATFVMTGAM